MTNINILDAFLVAGAFHGFVLAAAIYRARNKEGSSWFYLCVLVIVFSAGIIAHMVMHLVFKESDLHPYFIMSLFFLMGPCVYFYVRAVAGYDNRRLFYMNIIPAVTVAGLIPLFGFGILPVILIHGVEMGLHVVNGIQFTVYCILSFLMLRKHRMKIGDVYSSLEKVRLSWLKFLLGCFVIAVLLSGVTDFFMEKSFSEDISWDFYWLYMSFVVYAIGYKGLRQPEIWNDYVESRVSSKKKYEKNLLDPEKAGSYLAMLDQLMDEKIFLDPELSLPMLAEKLNVPVHQLSQVINTRGMN
ncbi:MAG TPA: hypothetical protein PKK43_04335, partial [Spirochaetota bacterium]|nr:hypothetical protein [Spirochaetota bacterium]